MWVAVLARNMHSFDHNFCNFHIEARCQHFLLIEDV